MFRLDFKVQPCVREMMAADREQFKNRIQRGNELIRVFVLPQMRMRAIEPTARVNLAQLGGGHLLDDSCTQTSPPQSCVMDHNWNAISR